jgi:uncharacterized membrane protein AbrB (regulator of aidB expression)
MPGKSLTSVLQFFIVLFVLCVVYASPFLVGWTEATLFYNGTCPFREGPRPCSFWEYARGGGYGITFILTWFLVPVAAVVFGWVLGGILLKTRVVSAARFLIGRLVCAGIFGLLGIIATVARVK